MERAKADAIAAEFASSKGYRVEAKGPAHGAHLLITEANGFNTAFVQEDNFWRCMEQVAARACPIPGEHF